MIIDDPGLIVCGMTIELLIRSSNIAREYVAVAGPPEKHPGIGRKRFSPAVAKCVVFVLICEWHRTCWVAIDLWVVTTVSVGITGGL